MIATLLAATLLQFASPSVAIETGNSQMLGYHKGKKLFEATLSPGGEKVPVPIVAEFGQYFILQFSGTCTSPGGRAVDGLFVFTDPYAPEMVPYFSPRVDYVVDGENMIRGFGDEIQVKRADIKCKNGGTYEVISRLPTGKKFSVLIPSAYWDNPKDKPKDPLSGGSIQMAIYEALPGEAGKQGVDFIDPKELFIDRNGVLPEFPAEAVSNAELVSLGNYTPKTNIQGIATDNASFAIVRVLSPSAGKVRISLKQKDGALYPLSGNPYKSAGSDFVETQTVTLPAKGDSVKPTFAAFAIYRPPSYPVNYLGARVEFKVDVTPTAPNNSAMSEEANLRLVRPPVVLVHGTYDDPKECWQTINDKDQSKMSMEKWLQSIGFDYVTCVDWKDTNGHKDPSSFETNQKSIWQNKNGIYTAIDNMRQNGIIATQADVIAHSQGGVISRVYARGYNLNTPLPPSHPHYNDPVACSKLGCWFHTKENHYLGSMHRLITISATHMGSDVCRLFLAYDKYKDTIGGVKGHWLGLFNWYVDNFEQATSTQGFLNQAPGSLELQQIGPTPVASHGIAGVSTQKDYMYQYEGFYYARLYKIWYATPINALYKCLVDLGQTVNAVNIKVLYDSYYPLETVLSNKKLAPLLEELRLAVFQNQENDCTVGKLSSWGGLEEPFRTRIEGVIHSYEPRYPSIQLRIAELLTNNGSLFDPRGFPNPYKTDIRTNLPSFSTNLGWSAESAAGQRPWMSKVAVTEPGTNTSFVVDEKGVPVQPEILIASMSPNAEKLLGDYQNEWLAGKYDNALASIAAAVTDSPKTPKLRNIYASALQAMGKYVESEQQAKMAVQLEPKNALWRAGHGNTLLYLGKVDEALEEYKQGLLLDPSSDPNIFGMGMVYLAQNKFVDAEACFREAISLQPKNSEYQGYLGNSLTGQGKYEDAMKYFEESVRLNANSAVGHGGKGLVLFVRAKYADAERELALAIKLSPTAAHFHVNRAAALYMLGRIDEAKVCALEAKRLGFTTHWVYEKLGIK